MEMENPNAEDTFRLDASATVTKCSTFMSMLEYKHHWDISQFSVHQEINQPGDSIMSTRFGDDDHEFQLKLFPCGKDEECSGHLSLFLQILKCPLPKLQFRVNFIIETLDGPRGCPLNKNVVTINRGGIVTASKFFSIDQLKARSSRFIPGDVLKIVTDMIVYGEANSETIDILDDTYPDLALSASNCGSRQSIAPMAVDLLKEASLDCLLQSGDFSDFDVVVDGTVFHLHKNILASRSGYFQAMLKPGNVEYKESKVEISDVPLPIMTKLINFMYTLKIPDMDDTTLDLVYAADRFLINSLKSRLMAAIGRNITSENVFSRLEVAYRLNDDRVFNKAAGFFAKNRYWLTTTDEWKRLRSENPGLAAEIIEKGWEQADMMTHNCKRRRTSN